MKKAIKWGVAILAVIAIIIAAPLCYTYYVVVMQKVELQETVYIYITPGDNAESIMKKINEAAAPKSLKGFEILAEHNNFDHRTRSGKFAINNGDNMQSIYRRIVTNQQTPVRITVPSTRTVEQIAATLGNDLMIDSADIMRLLSNNLYLSCFGYTKESMPSMFIPDTYEVYWNITAEDLIVRLLEERSKFWNSTRRAKAEAIGLTEEDVATLASIVDEETNNNEEKPIVAGLYINRLNRGMMLQADPTVKFALGDPTRRRILNSDLEVESPYNTYKHAGLPPGPIRIPTKQGLESVLNYQEHDYIYMCAKEDFSGTHNFARTLSEHNANARRYRQALNANNINR
ncbi:MAG: endolytic transglycosylase MltG [Bacteroidales bacterium]|nr:endolytic transglycosylase MltG [Bacteroidales bacterium]